MNIGRKAFTVAEIIIAIGFLAIIAVVVIGLFARLTASSSKSADQTVALQVADRLLEEYAGATPSVWKGMPDNRRRISRVWARRY